VNPRQRRSNRTAVGVGLLAATLVCALQLAGRLEWLERIALDLRFRHTNSIPQSDQLVCIDIDDRSLELIGRWPWPRDVQAGLISIAAELGAKAILVDLTYVEPQQRSAPGGRNADLLGPIDAPARADPDAVLRDAIRDAGNVYLAYHYPRTALERSPAFRRAVEEVIAEDTRRAELISNRMQRRYDDLRRRGGSIDRKETVAIAERAELVAALYENPAASQADVLARLQIDPTLFGRDTDAIFARSLEAALRRRVRAWLAERPERRSGDPVRLFADLHRAITGRTPRDDNGVRRALLSAVRDVLGYDATIRNPLLPNAAAADIANSIDGLTPVYFPLAAAARRCGFVNFQPDSDGVMRRERLLAAHGEHVLTQLALTVACDALELRAADITVAPDRITLNPRGAGGRARVIQLDRRGRTIIPWTRQGDYAKQFTHVPASLLAYVLERRQLIAHNEALIRSADESIAASRFMREHAASSETAELDDSLAQRLDRAAASVMQEYRRLLKNPGSVSPVELNRTFELAERVDQRERARTGIATLRAENASDLAPLSALLSNKICLIGYTATSLADMTPTPTSARMPGVMAHANLLNGLLVGRLVHWAPVSVNVFLAAIAGVLASWLSVTVRPRLGFLLIGFAAIAYVSIAGAAVFWRWAYWIALVPVVANLIVPFVAISIYRYVFIDAERRQLATALGQYTSKEIARQIAENPELCRKVEMREVSTMFTDLRGFTGISERIGAERTQRVLNTCLGAFTDVMLRRGAMMNKFLGDGVFVFWNPLIYPQPDHAARACETAIELFARLESLQRRREGEHWDDALADLALRVGIATGSAIVGPCGSEQKFDYTCIGDSVNVAARLESANKFYGTRVLVSEATQAQVGERFAFRPLGGVQVKGKQSAVRIFELLGYRDRVADADVEYAGAFAGAIEHFQQRRWTAAVDAFQECARHRPADLAA